MRKHIVSATLLVLVLALVYTIAYAAYPDPPDCSNPGTWTNHAANCGLESGLTPWDEAPSTASGSVAQSSDAARHGTYSLGFVYSGSATGALTQGAEQCVNLSGLGISAGDYVSFVANYNVQANPTRLTNVFIRMTAYQNADCATPNLGNIATSADQITFDGQFHQVGITGLVPANTNSIAIRMFHRLPEDPEGGSNSPVYWDDMLFYESNANAVTLVTLDAHTSGGMDIEAGPVLSVLALGAVGLGVLIIRRRAIAGTRPRTINEFLDGLERNRRR